MVIGWGSSPHTRGARLAGPGVGGERGIIPAYAGSTAQESCIDLTHVGSSPHTRGALALRTCLYKLARIIPAYAGSTKALEAAVLMCWDHPRIRGEHYVNSVYPALAAGSSPHTRGALALRTCLYKLARIIPAYAGSTKALEAAVLMCWDHPRIRGEHYVNSVYPALAAGSSPHTRGALSKDYGTASNLGDHPRIRGEHIIGSIGMVIGWGSSPHTRGALS